MEMSVTFVRFRDLEVVIWLHTKVDPPQHEWDAGIAKVAKWMNDRKLEVRDTRHLVVSDGGAPSVRQRSSLRSEVFRNEPCKLSIVTTVLSNPIKRGIATALQWMNPSVGFFTPAQAAQAASHLDLTGDASLVWMAYRDLQQRFPHVAALDSIADALALPQLKMLEHEQRQSG
jgi:hypothetical protein